MADPLPEALDRIEYQGKSYEVPAPEEKHFRALSAWLEDQALRKVEAQDGKLPPEVYERRYDAMMRAVGAGAFEPGQAEFSRGASSLEGRKQLLLILLQSRYPDFPEEAIGELFQPFWQQVQAIARQRAEEARSTTVASSVPS